MNKITPRVAMEVAGHEGIVRQTYFDSVGVATWSVGITSNTGHDVDRYWGNPQPIEKCIEVWLWALENYADDVRRAFAGHALTEEQFAAALSFHYNTGGIHKATWVKQWKARDFAASRASFMNWRKPAEIIPRRKAERDLFFDGKWSNNGTMTEYTRLSSRKTPDWGSAKRVDVSGAINKALGGKSPTSKPRTSIAQSTTVQASAGQIISGVGTAAGGVAMLDGTAQIVAMVIGGVVIVLGAYIMRERIKKWAAGVK